MPKSSNEHETHQYAKDVVDGKILVCTPVLKACQRHMDDLENGHERGLWFDDKAADRAFKTFSLLRLSKGKWGGKPFKLEPFQKFLTGGTFGWKRESESGGGLLRRFREVHYEVARKNGKTEWAAGVGAILTFADGEHGAEVYCLATKREQANVTFDVAKKLLSNPAMKPYIRRMQAEIRHDKSGSKMKPLGADSDTLDGLNVHGAIKDELHAWTNQGLWDVIDTATGAREQPLGVVTTTAGHNRKSIWWQRRDKALKLLDRVPGYDDDSFFPLIYTLDTTDDWENYELWGKGNPSLGVIIKLEDLKRQYQEAKQTPGQINAFRRLKLNQPTDTATQWIPADAWRRAHDRMDEAHLLGRPCFGGLDLSLTTDLTAWALIFPPYDGDPKYRLYVRHFMPKQNIEDKEARDGVPYRSWADGRRLILSEGDWVDYSLVEKVIREDAEKFKVLGIAYDNRFAPAIVQNLMADNITCVPWGQNHGSLNTGTKEFYRMILARELAHQGCPLLDWQAGNAAVSVNSSGYQKPDKEHSNKRIDGIAASVNATGLAIEQHGTGPANAGMFDLGW